MCKRKLRGARVLLTGGSSGIGRELALELARRGANVCVLARREEALSALVDEMNAIRAASFSNDPEHFYVVGNVCASDVREQAVAETLEQFGGLDLLINNAGAGATTPVEDTTDELACELFDLNFFPLWNLPKRRCPRLKRARRRKRTKSAEFDRL